MPKKLTIALCILGFAIAHFIVSFFVSFAAGIGGNTWYGGALMVVSKVLTFPLWLIPVDAGFGSEQTLVSWWPWAVLSLTWGGLIAWGLYRVRR